MTRIRPTITAPRSAAAAIALVSICTAGRAPAASHYTVVDLGSLEGSVSAAQGYSNINASGQVVGNSYSNNTDHAFRTAPNGLITAASDLGGLNGYELSATSINAVGQVVGFSDIKNSVQTRSYRTAPNGSIDAASDLGTLGGTYTLAYGINASGQTVGGATDGDRVFHAFRTAPNGPITMAGDLGPGIAMGINTSGQVVGFNGNRAFRTTATGGIDAASLLGTLGGNASEAHGINDAGQVVGWSNPAGSTVKHAFRTAANGGITPASDLGTIDGTDSFANCINASGEVVGYNTVGANVNHELVNHAFFVGVTGPMQDLNNLIPVGSGWVLKWAGGINDSGQIAGYGTSPSGQLRAFRLTPVSPGDANDDGKVGFADLVVVAQHYDDTDGTSTWETGDFTGDGNVNFADLVVLAQHYDSGPASAPTTFSSDFRAALASVPEPASVTLMALGGLALFRRSGDRRRRLFTRARSSP